jgi:predicted nucleic-acid-binding protein
MIGVDTNVLVRYFVADDEAQLQRAAAFLETAISEQEPGFVSVVVLAELAWVLERSYRLSREAIAEAMETVLRAEGLVVDREAAVDAALDQFRTQRVSFADALIGALATAAGCAHVVTFDRKAGRLPAFRVL